MDSSDTITAISTPVAPAARIVLRISGPDAHRIARELADVKEAAGGSAFRSRIWPGFIGWIYRFATPRSYSGEDLVEFHLPGSPVLARLLLDEIVRRGARQAEPGEFTARAYFNGRIDLTQAEGVAATIAAHSRREMVAARQLLSGELARRLAPIMEDLAQTLALIEVGIDFSDEDVTFLSPDQILDRLGAALGSLNQILRDSASFERLAHEPRIVLVGRPNAGKSTLLNALAGHQRAVVSDIAGTTRDALSAEVRLARGLVRLIDVAGLDDHAPAGGSVDKDALASIHHQMRQRALAEIETADLILLVHALDDPRPPLTIPRPPSLTLFTKLDLVDPKPVRESHETHLPVSARTGEGIDPLRQRLDRLAFGPEVPAATLALNARHVQALKEAQEALSRAQQSICQTPEVVALELREALDALGGILGKISPDDLLGRIFSKFCIGK